MHVVIVSGRSGSGKSVALDVLEDNGYNCIDNLPVTLLPDLLKHLDVNDQHTKVAVGIDSRNSYTDLSQIESVLGTLAGKQIKIEIIFLNTDLKVLYKRFSETRRKHPLSSENVDLNQALKKESNLLEPIMEIADYHIDTSNTTLHDLRKIMSDYIAGDSNSNTQIIFQSFGFKHGLPTNADYVFDVRFLPNPHWIATLRTLTGRDAAVADYLRSHEEVNEMLEHIKRTVDFSLKKLMDTDRHYVTIAIGCTGGQHRSVYITEQLYQHFNQQYNDVQLKHQELHEQDFE